MCYRSHRVRRRRGSRVEVVLQKVCGECLGAAALAPHRYSMGSYETTVGVDGLEPPTSSL